jgi:hypothetical protein
MIPAASPVLAMARGPVLAYIPHVPVEGERAMSSKSLQNLAFILLIALTLYVAFGGGI